MWREKLMILEDLFGNTTRIKILEELLSKWGEFLSVEEISRMADVSKKSVYVHMAKLEDIGVLDVQKEGSKKYRLNQTDERALALALIESNEYSRQLNNFNMSFESNCESSVLTVYDTIENDFNDLNLFVVEPVKDNSKFLSITICD